MRAYYNEIDPHAAQWLRNLIAAGHIAPGDVDTRSIKDVRPEELAPYTQCHFFAGIGAWSFALRLASWPDDRPVWTGSCPCQPFSAAGKGAGFDDARHLWPAWHRLIAECGPSVVFGEQVASKHGLEWLDLVLADMEGAGYACGAVDLCAAGVGAPHIRQRLWFVAERMDNAAGCRRQRQRSEPAHGEPVQADEGFGWMAHADAPHDPAPTHGYWRDADWLGCRDGRWRPVEPGTLPLAHGAPGRVGRLRAYGNAIVAPVAAEVISAFMEC